MDNDKKRLRRKNIVVGLGIACICLIFYFMTIIRVGS